MMYSPRPFLAALLVLAAATTAAEEATAPTPPAVLGEFKRSLMQALQVGMASGIAPAIEACRVAAPELAASLGGEGVRIGRSSHRLRNPDNAPPAWLVPLMDAYLADADDRRPRQVALPDGRTGYTEPILLKPMCVTCHGERLAPDVAEAIAVRYPEDAATGFKAGELRGVFWVEYPTPEP
ncbi:MAG: Tll0287-like domain-containing protein [Gammaproteobacteria bacterium]